MLKDILVELRNKLTGTNRVVQEIKQSNSDLTINKLIDGIQELKSDLGTEKIIQEIKELKTILNRNNYSYLKTQNFLTKYPQNEFSGNFFADKVPLFIIGVPRAGTTLLCKMLKSHPAILMTNETGVCLQLHNLILKAAQGRIAGTPFGKEYCELWSSQLNVAAPQVIRDYYHRIATLEQRQNVIYWGDKHPHNDTCLLSIQRWFPHARYIYVVRDPRDVVCSISQMNSWEHEKSFETWKKISSNYENFICSLNCLQLYIIRYEDLVSDYYAKMKEMYSWLELDIPNEVLESITALANVQSHSVNRTMEASGNLSGTKKHNPQKSSLGRWKRELTQEQAKLFELEAAEYLSKYY